jgi:phosphoribosylaminoimidazole-succinocarboxamide synthase
MDIETLKTYGAGYALTDATIPELPNHHQGKVRDSYDLTGGRRLLIASDRLSAFDLILTSVPLKGQVLTQAARYWFEATADICPNHVIAYPDPNVLLARRLTILPVEIVVRGYLAGTTGTSILTLYNQGRREMYGARFKDGLRANEILPRPIITPTTKADAGDHDAPLSAGEILERGLLSREQWEQVCDYALRLFARGQAVAAERGLILADTKYELGLDEDGRIVLADEIHTPDSSRYWLASSYPDRFARGERPESFDKDFVRAWVTARCDPYKDPIPAIPEELVLQTAEVYVRAFETITGQAFAAPSADEPVLQRIRRNLQRFF